MKNNAQGLLDEELKYFQELNKLRLPKKQKFSAGSNSNAKSSKPEEFVKKYIYIYLSGPLKINDHYQK